MIRLSFVRWSFSISTPINISEFVAIFYEIEEVPYSRENAFPSSIWLQCHQHPTSSQEKGEKIWWWEIHQAYTVIALILHSDVQGPKGMKKQLQEDRLQSKSNPYDYICVFLFVNEPCVCLKRTCLIFMKPFVSETSMSNTKKKKRALELESRLTWS